MDVDVGIYRLTEISGTRTNPSARGSSGTCRPARPWPGPRSPARAGCPPFLARLANPAAGLRPSVARLRPPLLVTAHAEGRAAATLSCDVSAFPLTLLRLCGQLCYPAPEPLRGGVRPPLRVPRPAPRGVPATRTRSRNVCRLLTALPARAGQTVGSNAAIPLVRVWRKWPGRIPSRTERSQKRKGRRLNDIRFRSRARTPRTVTPSAPMPSGLFFLR